MWEDFFVLEKIWSFLNFQYFGSEKQPVCGRSFDLASMVFLFNISWKSIRYLSGNLVFFVNVKLNLDIYRKDTIILTFLTFPWKHVWYHAGELYNLKLDNKTCCDSSEDDEGVDTGFNLQCQFLTMLYYFYNIYMILSVMSVNVSDDHYQCKNSYRMFKNGSGKKIIYRLQKNTEMYIVLNVSFIPFIFFFEKSNKYQIFLHTIFMIMKKIVFQEIVLFVRLDLNDLCINVATKGLK